MQRFKSPGQAQAFRSARSFIYGQLASTFATD